MNSTVQSPSVTSIQAPDPQPTTANYLHYLLYTTSIPIFHHPTATATTTTIISTFISHHSQPLPHTASNHNLTASTTVTTIRLANMSSSLYTMARRLNLSQMNTPAAARVAQDAVLKIGRQEIAAAGRWSVALGLIVYWMIEPNFETTK